MQMKSVRPPEDWEIYSYTVPEGTVVVSFYERAGEVDRTAYPHCARVIIPYRREESEEIYALEDELIELLDNASTSCIMLGTLTHAGKRELVFQLSDWQQFRPPVGRWIRKHQDVSLDVSEHEGWEFFDQFVSPDANARLFIADRNTVEALIRNGSDPGKSHDLEYVFLGTQQKLLELAGELESRGYKRYAGEVSEGQLKMVKSMTFDVDTIYEESRKNEHAAKRAGIKCDGWGTSIKS
jgi:hypothetical protein